MVKVEQLSSWVASFGATQPVFTMSTPAVVGVTVADSHDIGSEAGRLVQRTAFDADRESAKDRTGR